MYFSPSNVSAAMLWNSSPQRLNHMLLGIMNAIAVEEQRVVKEVFIIVNNVIMIYVRLVALILIQKR